MATPVTLGSTRQLWLAALTDTTPQFSFLEDASGTTKRAAQYGRVMRLGEPFNTGINSVWHQLTWQGGEGQDIWKDKQMYQSGDVDVYSYTGKMRMWPGFLSYMKWENHTVNARSVAMCEGSQSNIDWRVTPLYVGQRDHVHQEGASQHYLMYQVHPGYSRGDSRAMQSVHESTAPYRWIVSVQGDDYVSGILHFATKTKMYILVESTGAVTEDTNAPATGSQNYEYQWDSAVTFNEALYYVHGNRLYKRVPAPPYGVLGTHTLVKAFRQAVRLRGMCVWNNRLYFGLSYPSGRSAIYVTDGATSTKAFDFPHDFFVHKMIAHAGSLYILGMQTSDISFGVSTLVQQLYRYDGRSLKKLWQEGKFGDGYNHWPTDMCVWDGLLVWGRNGTKADMTSATAGTNLPTARANLMFYDPVNDAIMKGPGLDLDPANTGGGLWITGIANWNNTLMVCFKDDTQYHQAMRWPAMLAALRPEGYVRDDLRWPFEGECKQFAADQNKTRKEYLSTSEYHGDDDVATEKKTWLALRARVRITGEDANIGVYWKNPDGSEVGVTTINDDHGHSWQDVVIPLKNPSTGTYFASRKMQLKFNLYNSSHDYDNTDNAWIDDIAVEYVLTPTRRRQWQLRIPVTDGQLTLALGANSLTTADAMAQKLEDYFFTGAPIKFWEPTTSSATPANGAYVECRITDFQRHQARLASDETGTAGSVSLTLTENALT